MALSEHQFGNYMMTEEDFNFEAPTRSSAGYDPAVHTHWTRYRMMKEADSPWGGAKEVGTLEVQHKKAWGSTRYAGPVGLPTTATGPDVAPEHNQGWNKAWAERTAVGQSSNRKNAVSNVNEVEGQIPLFLHRSTQASDEVDTLIMSREGRHMAPTMLGVAANRAMATTGKDLGAPTNLSVHSDRMVGKLKAAGAVPEEHQRSGDFNSLNFVPARQHGIKGGLEGLHSHLTHWAERTESVPGTTAEVPLPASEAKRGQRTSRNVLKAGRPRPVQESEQLKLF